MNILFMTDFQKHVSHKEVIRRIKQNANSVVVARVLFNLINHVVLISNQDWLVLILIIISG